MSLKAPASLADSKMSAVSSVDATGGHEPQPGHDGRQRDIIERRRSGQQFAQAGPVPGLEDLAQRRVATKPMAVPGVPQIGVDQDYRGSCLRQGLGQVGGHAGAALQTLRAGHQEHPPAIPDRGDAGTEVTVCLGRPGLRGAGEDERRVDAVAPHPRHSGQHRGFQVSFQVGAVADPVVVTITQDDPAEAERQPQDRPDRQQDLLSHSGRRARHLRGRHQRDVVRVMRLRGFALRQQVSVADVDLRGERRARLGGAGDSASCS